MKKIFVFTILCLVCNMMKAEIASGTCGKDGDNITWCLSDDYVLTLSGSGEMADYSHDNYSPWNSYRSKLTGCVIPDGITHIGTYAFYFCSKMASVTVPCSVISIGNSAFLNCQRLESIVVEDGNPTYDSRDNCNAIIETSTNKLIHGCQNTIIPGTVTSIGKDAFYGCDRLKSINIPNSVTSIGDQAFEFCSGLTSVTIPNSVTILGNYAFGNCTALTSMIIPKSVTSIGSCIFWHCSSLASIVVEEGNPKYDSRDNCNAIIETSTNKLIQGCNNTVIPGSVTSIGDYALYYFPNLTSITIPASVTEIGRSAFALCSRLNYISCQATTPPVLKDDIFFSDKLTTITLAVPSGSVDAYKSADYWKNITNIISNKCETPTITYKDGHLTYSSAAEGVSYESTVSVADAGTYTTDDVPLSLKYVVTAYAIKDGYEKSEPATFTLDLTDSAPRVDTVIVEKEVIKEVTVEVHDTTYVEKIVEVPVEKIVEVHDTTYVDVPVEKIVEVHDTIYIYDDTHSDITLPSGETMTLYITDGKVCIENAPVGETITAYTTSGKVYVSMKVTGKRTELPLARAAVYLIKVGEKTFKIKI